MATGTGTMKPRNEDKAPGTYFPHQETKPRTPEEPAGVTDKARELASSVADKARETATTVADKARETAATVADKATGVATTVGQKAESATSAVGDSMKHLAGTIREHAPESGMFRSATTEVANKLESGGRYLQEEGLRGIGEDLTNMVRRNPMPALFVGIALGFLIARATRS